MCDVRFLPAADAGLQGDRLKEAQNINKSLSSLGDCVQSLVAKAKHIPFRNSKLTFLLQVRPPPSLLPAPALIAHAPRSTLPMAD